MHLHDLMINNDKSVKMVKRYHADSLNVPDTEVLNLLFIFMDVFVCLHTQTGHRETLPKQHFILLWILLVSGLVYLSGAIFEKISEKAFKHHTLTQSCPCLNKHRGESLRMLVSNLTKLIKTRPKDCL